MGILGEILSPAAIAGGAIAGTVLLFQPRIWAWRILGAFVLWDCLIWAYPKTNVVRTPEGFPAPEVMGYLDQADVSRAAAQLAGAILVMIAMQIAWAAKARLRA